MVGLILTLITIIVGCYAIFVSYKYKDLDPSDALSRVENLIEREVLFTEYKDTRVAEHTRAILLSKLVEIIVLEIEDINKMAWKRA